MSMTGTAISHDKCIELIPWFVNETLEETERRLVERHVRECLPCRSVLREERKTCKLVLARDLPANDLREGLSRLEQRIDRDAGAGRVAGWRPTGFHVAGAFAAAVLVVAVGILAWQTLPLSRPQFTTLGDDGASAAARIDIVFADDLDGRALQTIVEDIGGSIVSGPSGIGRYTIELNEPIAPDDVSELLRALREDPRIRFAGQSFIEPGTLAE